jgi:hypothetical protein
MNKLKHIHDKFDKHSHTDVFVLQDSDERTGRLTRCACGDWKFENSVIDPRIFWYIDKRLAKKFPHIYGKYIQELKDMVLANFNQYIAPRLGDMRATEILSLTHCKEHEANVARGDVRDCKYCGFPTFWKDINPYTMSMILQGSPGALEALIVQPWISLMGRSDAQLIVNYFASRIMLNEYATETEETK